MITVAQSGAVIIPIAARVKMSDFPNAAIDDPVPPGVSPQYLMTVAIPLLVMPQEGVIILSMQPLKLRLIL